MFLWNAYVLTQPVLLALALKRLVRDSRVKIAAFVVLVITLVSLISFMVEWFLYEQFPDVSYFIEALNLLILLPLAINAMCKLYSITPATYDPQKSYLAFRKPKSLLGFIAALVKSPYGHCSLITKERRFKFSRGILSEVKFRDSGGFCLKEIRTVPLSEARELLGHRWGVFNNCFTVFRKFK